jgi:hypothetical protein
MNPEQSVRLKRRFQSVGCGVYFALPPLWSGGQRSRFDSRRYQIF